ncbi:MAG: PhoH family protein [Ruthenibacterium sp.]|jgi:phoH family protein|nr:PhoH family protein [Oscillospiraceae bacterium]
MAETRMEVDSMDTALAVFGSCDENIRLLEQALGVTVVCRGTELKFSGPEEAVQKARRAVDAMLSLREGGTPLEEQTVRYCISLADAGEEEKVQELAGGCIAITAKGRPVRPKTLGQKQYVEAILKNAVTFGVGPAGTGKTYLAVAMAVKAFKARQVGRIILTRPAVEAGEKLGFLPGDLQNKVDPYLRPLYDALFDMLGAETYQKLLEKQLIEVAPLAYMRGRTLDDAFIILDEAQNTSPEQMKMFLTRMGTGSKVVVTGDVTQIDLPDKARSGLVDALQVLKTVQGIAMMFFSEKDVVRHRLVQEIIRAYDKAQAVRHKRG